MRCCTSRSTCSGELGSQGINTIWGFGELVGWKEAIFDHSNKLNEEKQKGTSTAIFIKIAVTSVIKMFPDFVVTQVVVADHASEDRLPLE